MGLLYALFCNLLFDLKNILWKAFHLPLLPRLAGQIWRSLIETQQPLWALPTSFKIPLMVYSHFQQPQKTRNIPPAQSNPDWVHLQAPLAGFGDFDILSLSPPFSNFKLKFDVEFQMLPGAACRALRLKQWQHLPGETHRSFFGPWQHTAGI